MLGIAQAPLCITVCFNHNTSSLGHQRLAPALKSGAPACKRVAWVGSAIAKRGCTGCGQIFQGLRSTVAIIALICAAARLQHYMPLQRPYLVAISALSKLCRRSNFAAVKAEQGLLLYLRAAVLASPSSSASSQLLCGHTDDDNDNPVTGSL